MATKNKGLNLLKEQQEISPEDWTFSGASQKCLADIPEDMREYYLPEGERQNLGSEKQDCATRSVINILETKFNWLYKTGKLDIKWFKDNGYIENNKIVFSDRYIAILSGTNRDGNSLIAPIKAIHKYGLIPKPMFPQVRNWDEYYSGITDEMKKLGQEFLKRFTINYERIYEKQYEELLHIDLLNVAGYAWTNPLNNEYPKTDLPPNHAFMIYKTPMSYAYDNYEEAPNDWIKKLAKSYNFYKHGYRIFLSNRPQQITIMQKILDFLKKILGLDQQIIEIIEKEPELKPSYLWNTKENARHSCRVIMDTYKIKWADKDLLCAVIEAESNFDTQAVHDNGWSKDWGICQICDKKGWHIGKGLYFKSVEEVLNFPEKSIQFMCEMFKAGKLNLWCSFQNGLYKKYLA